SDSITFALTGGHETIGHVFDPYLPIGMALTFEGAPSPPMPGECTTYPAIEPVPAIPGRGEVGEHYGWNAGANSVEERDGDVELVFSEQPKVVGAVIGLVGSRDGVGSHDRMTHAFYFSQTQGGGPRYQVMESGRTATEPQPYEEPDEFRVQRVDGVVQY